MCTFYGLSGVGEPDLSDSGYLRFSSTSTRSTESTIPIRRASVTIASVQIVITHEYTPAAVRRNSIDPRPGTGSLYGLTVSFGIQSSFIFSNSSGSHKRTGEKQARHASCPSASDFRNNFEMCPLVHFHVGSSNHLSGIPRKDDSVISCQCLEVVPSELQQHLVMGLDHDLSQLRCLHRPDERILRRRLRHII